MENPSRSNDDLRAWSRGSRPPAPDSQAPPFFNRFNFCSNSFPLYHRTQFPSSPPSASLRREVQHSSASHPSGSLLETTIDERGLEARFHPEEGSNWTMTRALPMRRTKSTVGVARARNGRIARIAYRG